MTAPRRQRKSRSTAFSRRDFLAAAVLIPAAISAGRAATTEQVVTDRNTGLAIGGFDPVAYFIDGAPLVGRDEFEHTFARAVWRFRNEGNRASFVSHPKVYGPRFGGYDPVDVGRGVTYAGNPRIWLIVDQRLYLFGREQSRDAFAANPARFLKDADGRWPVLEAGLSE